MKQSARRRASRALLVAADRRRTAAAQLRAAAQRRSWLRRPQCAHHERLAAYGEVREPRSSRSRSSTKYCVASLRFPACATPPSRPLFRSAGSGSRRCCRRASPTCLCLSGRSSISRRSARNGSRPCAFLCAAAASSPHADNTQSHKVVIVNETFARRFWPNQNPLGKHILVGRWTEPAGGDRRQRGHQEQGVWRRTPQAQLYVPFPQLPWANMNLLVRTSVPPQSMTSAVRAQISAVDPDQPVDKIQTVDDLVDSSRAQPRFTMLLLGIFSATALALAADRDLRRPRLFGGAAQAGAGHPPGAGSETHRHPAHCRAPGLHPGDRRHRHRPDRRVPADPADVEPAVQGRRTTT